ncbi:hypothetical protein G6F65_022744 [Rhizopus arrhizus]|nr:hypothetical protein G6F65_022744 [Rhizopus arrhizus]
MAMRLPRTLRSAPRGMPASCSSPSRISPPAMRRPRGNRPRTACANVDLPDPDSPTTQTISRGFRARLTPSTANARSPPAGSEIDRFSI